MTYFYSTDSKEHQENMADLADTRSEEEKARARFWDSEYDAMDRFFEEENYQIGRCHICGIMNHNLNRCNCAEPCIHDEDFE